ncbi:glucosaminidase domain-containing protein [Isobaculum melis]|uniref:Peptidoglycan hydrolase n=1 Tax=Isobaculum melis TaxID=142588 RepID=A0A1H9THF6_9LACT|nr:glucosaminidase domain-containing protein [Isobaculum melis]SER96467.1 Flagellum-specific peptidoglycan hydrolase FlgJ [Isobaculum melis]
MSKTKQFLQSIKAGAIAGWYQYGILPSVSAAQAVIESGWGMSTLAQPPNHNLFGIKGSYNGQFVTLPTQEWDGSQYITIQGNFRKYPSCAESVKDHGAFFHEGPRYLGLIGMRDYEVQCLAIQNCGYATDPNYAEKLMTTIRANDLVSWDQEVLVETAAAKTPAIKATHTVQIGDTLTSIAQHYGTTIEQLMLQN